jgi:hypothetical protein
MSKSKSNRTPAADAAPLPEIFARLVGPHAELGVRAEGAWRHARRLELRLNALYNYYLFIPPTIEVRGGQVRLFFGLPTDGGFEHSNERLAADSIESLIFLGVNSSSFVGPAAAELVDLLLPPWSDHHHLGPLPGPGPLERWRDEALALFEEVRASRVPRPDGPRETAVFRPEDAESFLGQVGRLRALEYEIRDFVFRLALDPFRALLAPRGVPAGRPPVDLLELADRVRRDHPRMRNVPKLLEYIYDKYKVTFEELRKHVHGTKVDDDAIVGAIKRARGYIQKAGLPVQLTVSGECLYRKDTFDVSEESADT